jgi:ribosomal protein S18 acetylase RimI-like enzyme
LARALLTRSLQMFKDMGMDHAALGVDTKNLSGALDLYQSVGFRVEKRQTAYRKKLLRAGPYHYFGLQSGIEYIPFT